MQVFGQVIDGDGNIPEEVLNQLESESNKRMGNKVKSKKKIIYKPDYSENEMDYSNQARICPNCGSHQKFSSNAELIEATANNKVIIGEYQTHRGTIYKCRNCGCMWQ